MYATAVAVLVGSLRKGSINRQVAEVIADRMPGGVHMELVENLGEVPFYNEDLDNDLDMPAAAAHLRDRVRLADCVLAVTPEYNGTMPAVLSNAIAWLSRPFSCGVLIGKPFGVIGVTPSRYGGRWAHEDAIRAARIAGADVHDELTLSQSAGEVDVLTDPATLDRMTQVVLALAGH